ncbi:MAG: ribulose-phosphate 3-epimerase [Phycisphaeraceae bacterium]|nr:ribulose-phosphate 3-epimerase [Phycisphaeraceae bacterium]
MKRSSALRLPKPGTIQVAPSVLSADFARLADEIQVIKSAGLSIVHLDVMDGHFVPNITFGPPVVKWIRACTDLVLDCHLMISEPGQYVEAFAKAGADHISVHIETEDNTEQVINTIHKLGCTAGVTLNPETPVSAIEAVAPLCEMVLVMTVHPGFGGQSFILEAAQKVKQVRQIVGPDVRIQVDGGIDATTTPTAVEFGADTLVAGNAIFGQKDRFAAIQAIQDACA